MKSRLKAVGLTIVVILFVGLQIAAAVVRWNEPEHSFDPDSVDIGPQIQQILQQQQDARMKKVWEDIDRTMAAARLIADGLRERWADARKRGLVGETGVIYIPTDRELTFDGSIPMMGPAQAEPPTAGWYVVVKRFKTPSGGIKAATEVKQAKPPVIAPRTKSPTATSPAAA